MKKYLYLVLVTLFFAGCQGSSSSSVPSSVKKTLSDSSKTIDRTEADFYNKMSLIYDKKISRNSADIFGKRLPATKEALYWLMSPNDDSKSKYMISKYFTKRLYSEAKEYCENLNLGGSTDWSLPFMKEQLYGIAVNVEFISDEKIISQWIANSMNLERKNRFFNKEAVYNTYLAVFDSDDIYNLWKYETGGIDEKAKFACVAKSNKKNLSWKEFRVFIASLYYFKKNDIDKFLNSKFAKVDDIEMENAKFEIQHKDAKLNKLLYTKNLFPEIQRITQELINVYLQPKELFNEPMPKNILKPKAPKIPKFVKGEFETKKIFQQRVNKALKEREDAIKSLQKKYREDVEARNKIVQKIGDKYLAELKEVEIEQKYKKSVLEEKIQEFQIASFETVTGGFKLEKRSYDAETQTMYVTMKAKRANYSKKLSLEVPIEKAKVFANNIEKVKANVKFEFANNQITLKSIEAEADSGTYMAVLDAKDFKPEKMVIVAKTKKVKFDSAKQMRMQLQNPNLKDTYQIEALAYKDGIKMKGIKGVSYNDDIPNLLAHIKKAKIDKKKWLFIIGIEKYSETDDIAYSRRSALEFKEVAQKTLGIKERNTYILLDDKATSGRIKNKFRLMLSEVKKGDTVYFYYNGHGVPDPSNNSEPYMLPSDMIPDFITSEKEFALKNIYKQLSDSKASYVVGFIDSCFSGATDGESIIKGVAASRLSAKKVIFNKKKMVILTAGQKKQYSNMYKEKGHRMFSYYVMKSLISGKRDINSLYKEVSYKVSEQSNELGALKKQEPTLDGNKNIRL